jgi:hypothetical protein
VIIDPITNSILGLVTNSITALDALRGIDPTAGSDLAVPATEGTEADPTGGNGGLFFGDGGAGWTSTEAGLAGGNGGDASVTTTGQTIGTATGTLVGLPGTPGMPG